MAKKVGKTTERIRKEQKGEHTLYKQLQSELHFMAFAATKEVVINQLRIKQGTMKCILCGSDLHFNLAFNNHLHIQCTREGCIKAME